MTDQITIPTELLRSLVDEDDCWFDHHGGCQAHGYLSLEPGEKCPHQEAKELLARAKQETCLGLNMDCGRPLPCPDHRAEQCPHCTSDRRNWRFVMPTATGTAPCGHGWHDGITAPSLACTCPLGPEDAHLSDCPMWVSPAVDGG